MVFSIRNGACPLPVVTAELWMWECFSAGVLSGFELEKEGRILLILTLYK